MLQAEMQVEKRDPEVPCLTAGLPTPDSVAAQKEVHARRLERELRDAVDELAKEHRTLTDNLHANANHQRSQYQLALARMVKEQETTMRKEYDTQLLELRQVAQREIAQLEQQAELLVELWRKEELAKSQPRPSVPSTMSSAMPLTTPSLVRADTHHGLLQGGSVYLPPRSNRSSWTYPRRLEVGAPSVPQVAVSYTPSVLRSPIRGYPVQGPVQLHRPSSAFRRIEP
ncbi:unnamed protein product [Durusdinium trenchii]|uniref:Uncharacterized protein n=1 Tax=Durusdinium trenchii TaxID=1381693 RepID=A0ABP0RSU5_9DINO